MAWSTKAPAPLHGQQQSVTSSAASSETTSRRQAINLVCTGAAAVVASTSTPSNAFVRATVNDENEVELALVKPANPFIQLETVGMVPKAYFEENRSIYAFTERILDGDTIRVRHVPGYSFSNQEPEPLKKRGIADETLLIRLYGVDCPEIAKNKNQVTQPFGDTAKQFTSDLVYHQMVKITFLQKDRYGRAIAMVETLPSAGFALSGLPGLGTKDLSLELARNGLAELYTGGGAEYYVSSLVSLGEAHRRSIDEKDRFDPSH